MKKQSLTPEEVIRVAYGNLVGLVEHPILAAIFCVNQGRVAEAIQAIRYTMEHHKLVYRVAVGKARIVDIEPIEEKNHETGI